MTPPFFYEMAERGMDEFLKMQKRALDLVLNRSTAYMDVLRANPLPEDGGGIARLVRDSAEYFVSMHRNAADFAAEQTRNFCDTMKSEPNAAETPVSNAADAIQRGTEAVVQAQKRFWEMMMKPLEDWKFEAGARS